MIHTRMLRFNIIVAPIFGSLKPQKRIHFMINAMSRNNIVVLMFKRTLWLFIKKLAALSLTCYGCVSLSFYFMQLNEHRNYFIETFMIDERRKKKSR